MEKSGEKFKKVIVVTGASAGIGADLLDIFHDQGFRVAGMARRLERMEAQCARLNGVEKDSALAVACDVSDEKSLEKGFSDVLKVYGRVDGVVANAGFGVAGMADALTTSDYRRQFDTNVFGVLSSFYPIKEELKKNRGFFAAVGSVNSYVSLPTSSAYCMSKFAVRAFMEALYWEMKPLGVGVTLICPGFVKTEIRKVNNQGVFKEKGKDPIPEWIMQPSRLAAEQTARACLKRKKEVILSYHGKLAVFLGRHFPWVLSPVSRSLAQSESGTRWNSKTES